MRPAVKRRLVTLAAGASLLLCVVTVALWLRSYRRGDFVTRFRSGTFREIASSRGRLYIKSGPTSYPDGFAWTTGAPHFVNFDVMIPNTVTGWQFLGFGRYGGTSDGVPRRVSVLVGPYWSFLLLFLASPGVWMLRRRPLGPGRCRACGYDLLGTPARCPECGGVPAVR